MGQKTSKSSSASKSKRDNKDSPSSKPSVTKSNAHTPYQPDKETTTSIPSLKNSPITIHTDRNADSSTSKSTDTSNSKLSPKNDTKSSLEVYFEKYKDTSEDAILAEGVESFCDDLGVDPTDFIVLVLAWKFQASEMCRFTREEFMNGCQKLKAMDAKGLKKRFPDLIKEINESDKSFKELYQFTFTFGLDHATGQRALPSDMAMQLWELLFTHKKYPLLLRWLEFLQINDTKTITRDTWNMFLPFLQSMNSNLDNYDESEAWPTLFDDFVDFEQAKATAGTEN